MEKVKTFGFLIFFVFGLASLCLSVFYVLSGFWYTTDSMEYQGEIAFLPRWILPFSVLIFLGYSKRVKTFLLNSVTEKKPFARKRLRMARFK